MRHVASLLVEPPTDDDRWFNALADYLGPAYLRNAFTKGTEQEVDFLVRELGLERGMRVLDVGCGPGRHSLALARRELTCHGVDASATFVELAHDAAAAASVDATFEVGDVRDLDRLDEFDALICLCQGGFGLLRGDEDTDLLARFARAVRPGGRLAISAFHAPFAIRHLDAGESFDVATGVLHETATLKDDAGQEQPFDLWTTCFTARELRLLATSAGLCCDTIAGVAPGAYRTSRPTIDDPELLLLASRPVSR